MKEKNLQGVVAGLLKEILPDKPEEDDEDQARVRILLECVGALKLDPDKEAEKGPSEFLL